MGDNEDNPFVNRNKWVLPAPERRDRVCPACKSDSFSGRNIQGDILFTCLNESCKNQWSGGFKQPPEDPRIPKLPVNPKDKPRVMFDYDPIKKEPIEIDYPVDLTQDFRKGAMIPDEDDYE